MLRARRPEADRGRISRGPDLADDFLVQDGVLTRTVADTAALLDLLSGYEVGDASWAPPPSEPFASAAAREPGRLRIGYTTTPPIEAPLDTLCEQAVRDAAQLLTELGHEVEEVAAPWSRSRTCSRSSRSPSERRSRWASTSAASSRPRAGARARGAALLAVLGGRPRAQRARLPARAHGARPAISRGIIALWESYDVVLTPGLAERPVRDRRDRHLQRRPWADFGRSGRFTPYTALFNVTGQPAVSVPLFHGADGLPTASSSRAGPPTRSRCSPSPPSSRRPAPGPIAARSSRRPRSRAPRARAARRVAVVAEELLRLGRGDPTELVDLVVGSEGPGPAPPP